MNLTNVKSYVDDAIIYARNEQSNLKHLENFFALLINHGRCIWLNKCSFMQPRVEALENCIDKEGIHTDEREIQTIGDSQL